MTTADDLLTGTELRVRYRNGALGIRDVSIRVARGQVTGLFGPNGAGKTTTVRAMSGFLRTEGTRVIAGRVRLAERDVTNWEPHRLARLGVAFVPERNKVFSNLSVADNLASIGKSLSRDRTRQLYDLIHALFPILRDRRSEMAGRLSGGQRQMLALARAILCDPSVLIIDEMTLGLHHSLQPALFAAVAEVARQGTGVLVVDENVGLALDVVHYCYLLVGGVIRDEGEPAKFRGSELLAAGYVDAQ